MDKKGSLNMWAKLHFFMAAVFALFGVYYLHDGGIRIAGSMLVLAAHALFAAVLYRRHPEYASNGSNMSAFLTNFQRVLLAGCVYGIIYEIKGGRPSAYIMIILGIGAAAALYFTVISFLAFSRDLSAGGRN